MQAGELAAQTALQVQTAAQGVRQAEAAVGQAAAGGGLSLSLNGVYGRTGPIPTAQFEGHSVSLGNPEIGQVSANLTQPLYTGGRVQYAVRAARSGVDAAQQQVEATRRAVRLAAQQAAYQVLRAQELAEVAHRQTEANREHLRIAQAMFQAGTVAQFEVIQAQTQLAQSEGSEIAALTAVEQALAALRQILVLDQTRPVRIVPSPDPITRPPGDLAALIAQGWEHRPEMAALQAGVQAAESRLRLAKAGLNPTLALTGEYSRSKASFFSTGTSWQVALGASKPIFDGGLTRSQVSGAEAQLKQAQLAVDTQKQQVALDVTQPYLSLDQATKQLQVATQGVVNARERARVAEVRFQAGVTNGVEVLDAQTSLAAAEAAQVNANYDLQLALLQLYQAMGQPLTGGEKQ
jgi:outer membrane protein TolC